MPGEENPSGFVDLTLSKARKTNDTLGAFLRNNERMHMVPVRRDYLVRLRILLMTMTALLGTAHDEIQKRIDKVETIEQANEILELIEEVDKEVGQP